MYAITQEKAQAAQANNDGGSAMPLNVDITPFLNAYGSMMLQAGVSQDRMARIREQAISQDGRIDLTYLIRAGRAVETEMAFSDDTADAAYEPNDAIDEVISEAAQPRRTPWKRAAVTTGLILGALAGTAAADMTSPLAYNSGTQTWSSNTQDNDFYAALDVQGGPDQFEDLFGIGSLTVANLGQESRESFGLRIVDGAYQLPSGWTSSYDSGTGYLSVVGDLDPGNSELINFTYDPTGIRFGLTDLAYNGPITSGELSDMHTLDPTVVPVPGALLMGLLGFGAIQVIKGKRKLSEL